VPRTLTVQNSCSVGWRTRPGVYRRRRCGIAMFEALHPRRPGGRVAVWIVAAIALTSIATGVGAILTRPALETAARSAIFRPSQSSAGPSLASPCSLPPGECVGGTGWRTSPPSSSLPCPGHTVSSSSERCQSRSSFSRSVDSPSSSPQAGGSRARVPSTRRRSVRSCLSSASSVTEPPERTRSEAGSTGSRPSSTRSTSPS